jgi:hypothetical protein
VMAGALWVSLVGLTLWVVHETFTALANVWTSTLDNMEGPACRIA